MHWYLRICKFYSILPNFTLDYLESWTWLEKTIGLALQLRMKDHLSADKFNKLYDKKGKVAEFLVIITLHTKVLVVKSFTFRVSRWMSFLVMKNYGKIKSF